jgi:hypothetical protein
MASAENTVCLSVNQASSIQNMGVTLESFTLGHNPYKLALSAAAIFLPTSRPKFFSEWTLGSKLTKGMSAGAMMGMLSSPASALRKPKASEVTNNSTRPKHFQIIEPLKAKDFIGEWMFTDEEYNDLSSAEIMERQGLVQSLYEGRCASLERFVGFLILFHHLSSRVASFWPRWSCGMLGYDMSRTQSIMRIATTASPVGGSEVRHKMLELAEETRRKWAVRTLQLFFRFFKQNKSEAEVMKMKAQLKEVERMRHDYEAKKAGAKKNGDAVTDLVSAAKEEVLVTPRKPFPVDEE